MVITDPTTPKLWYIHLVIILYMITLNLLLLIMLNLDNGKNTLIQNTNLFFHPTVTQQILIFILKFSSKWLIYMPIQGVFSKLWKKPLTKGVNAESITCTGTSNSERVVSLLLKNIQTWFWSIILRFSSILCSDLQTMRRRCCILFTQRTVCHVISVYSYGGFHQLASKCCSDYIHVLRELNYLSWIWHWYLWKKCWFS